MPGIGIGVGIGMKRKGLPYPTAGLQVIVYNQTYEEEGTTYLRTSTGVGIPKVSGTGLDTIWDFSVLNDARFDKGSYVGNAYGLPEYYDFPYVNIYYDDTSEATRYHWKFTDFHYANLLAQSLLLDNQMFLRAKATTETSNEISEVYQLNIYESEQTGSALTKLKTWIRVQTFFGENLITNAGFTIDSGWSKHTGWTISNGKARYDASSLNDVSIYQVIGLEVGKTYKVGITSEYDENSSFRIYIGNTNSGNYYTGLGIKERISEVPEGANGSIYFRAKFNTQLILDNAYCYKLYQNYYKP